MAIKDHLFFTSYIAMFGRFLTNLNYHIADEVWGQIELVGHSKKNEQSTALLEWLTQVKDNERLRQWAERNKCLCLTSIGPGVLMYLMIME